MTDDLTSTEPTGSGKRFTLRYAGVCRLCGADLPAREAAIYEPSTTTVRCLECPAGESLPAGAATGVCASSRDPVLEASADDAGVAGASARREYERRKARDEERLRQKWGKLGRIAVALADENQSTKAWATGAGGEEHLGARLDALASESIAVLHDRRIPGTRANIDHIAITSAGVWVIDAKRYKGPEVRIEGGVLRTKVEKVLAGRRDRSRLQGPRGED